MIKNNSPIIQNNGENNQEIITTQEAAQMANFSNQYNNTGQPQFSGYGLISSPNVPQYGTLGYNPGVQSFNPQVSYNRGANPQYNNPQYRNYNHVYQDQSYTIPGFNPFNSETIYSSDLEERQKEILDQMNKEMEEYNKNNVYSNNYYGNLNRTNPFIVEKYRKKQYAIEQEAKRKRIDLSKRLSSAAYTFLNGEQPDEEYLNNIYNDRQVTVPAVDVEAINIAQELDRCTVDIVKLECANFINHNNNVSNQHNSLINPNMSMIEFFENAGELYALGMQEEVDKDRRDKSKMYDNSNNYRRYLAQQLERRDGTSQSTLFPNLFNSSNILDDGTLQIGVPEWLKVKDKQESERKYAESKQKFIESIYNPRR